MDRSSELITNHSPKSPVSEAYRTLRTNLCFASPDYTLKSIMFTSSGAGEGKSLTITNLAITLAQDNKKVIIIDADLRKPMQHRFFGLTNYSGLSNILTDKITFAEGLRETFIEGLSLISTGTIPPNPAELLGSKKMDTVIEKAETEADMVLIDTAPTMPVTDPVLLANKVDGVIIVTASHETHQEMLFKTKESLDRVRANIIGVVLNKYPINKQGTYYSQYYHYYGVKK